MRSKNVIENSNLNKKSSSKPEKRRSEPKLYSRVRTQSRNSSKGKQINQQNPPGHQQPYQNVQKNQNFKKFKRNVTSKYGSSQVQVDPREKLMMQQTRKSTPFEKLKYQLDVLEYQIRNHAKGAKFVKQVQSMKNSFNQLSRQLQQSIESQRQWGQKSAQYEEIRRQLEQEFKQAKKKHAEAEQLSSDARKKYHQALQSKDPQTEDWKQLKEEYMQVQTKYQVKVNQLQNQLNNLLDRIERNKQKTWQKFKFGLEQFKEQEKRVYLILQFVQSDISIVLNNLHKKKKLLVFWKAELNRTEEILRQRSQLTIIQIERLQAAKKNLIAQIRIAEKEYPQLERKMKNY